MGFTRRTLRLIFEDPEFEGLEIRALPMTIGQLLEVGRFDQDDDKPTTLGQKVDRYLPDLAAAIIDWNHEELDGTPTPHDVAGLRSLDPAFVLRIINAWAEAAAAVLRPLEPRSNDGEPSQEASLPMEVLSPNPPS